MGLQSRGLRQRKIVLTFPLSLGSEYPSHSIGSGVPKVVKKSKHMQFQVITFDEKSQHLYAPRIGQRSHAEACDVQAKIGDLSQNQVGNLTNNVRRRL